MAHARRRGGLLIGLFAAIIRIVTGLLLLLLASAII
jgi:hypothetical protein